MLKPLFLLILWIPRQLFSYLKQIWSLKRYPPGPFPLPVVGSMWRLLGIGVSEATFRKLAKRYGNICSLWGGPYHIIILSGYQAVKEGLIDHSEAFADRPITPFVLASTQKRGIVFSNGHIWEQQRQFGIVTMRKLGLGNKGMESQIQEEAQQLMEFFAETKGQPFDPSLPIMRLVCSVICTVAFGHRFSIDDKDFLELMKAISIALKFGGNPFYVLYEAFPNIMKHLPGPHQTALSALETIVSFARKEIAQHKENQNLHEPQDFIDFYLLKMEKKKDDPDSTYNEDNLALCITDLFIAGTDTTYASLTWAMLLMANNVDVQDKVHKEMDEVFGSLPSISYQKQKKLPYTNAVIHEIIRKKYPFLFGLPRQCVQNVELNGFLIPKGAVIFPDLRSVLLDPEHWEAPEEFNPNHFLDKEGHFVEKEAFLPFGAGARACLGELLAKTEFFNIFTRLLRHFRLEPPEGVEKLSEKSIIGVSVHPAPFKICALPRVRTP
ncbi:cytochrome P450 2J2-like [Thamnophis elegans]|uniref:cytochrome P450 2J2-like n=1 Tax=Thamnophis elegans TaxID=35005 RepID=UPI0013787834|nr:cytochrome P450 2J2-like [Thamnophis elegans]